VDALQRSLAVRLEGYELEAAWNSLRLPKASTARREIVAYCAGNCTLETILE